ncbi:hypothetical protein Tco_0088987 [Tanacetum coccineum]
MQLIQKLRGDLKCMKKVVPSSRSKATNDIISIGSFVEVLVLNHYVLVRKILGKLSKLHDEVAQNKTNIQEPRKPFICVNSRISCCGLLKKGLLVEGKASTSSIWRESIETDYRLLNLGQTELISTLV